MIAIKVALKNAEFRSGLQQLRKDAANFKNELAQGIPGGSFLSNILPTRGAGYAAIFAGLIAGFKKVADVASDAVDKAGQFGSTAEGIQRVGYAAQLAGTDIDKVGTVANKLTLAAKEAAAGGGEMAKVFDSLGISAQDFIGADLEDKVIMLGTAYDNANGSVEKQSDLLKLLGAKGAEILPMLASGAAGLREQMDSIPVISNKLAESLDDLGDKFVWLKEVSFGVLIKVVEFMNKVAEKAQQAGEWLGKLSGGGEIDPSLSEEAMKQAKRQGDFNRRQIQRTAEAQQEAIERGMEMESKAANAQAKNLEEIAKLKEQINKQDEDAYTKTLGSFSKILYNEEAIAALKGSLEFIDDEKRRLEIVSKIKDIEAQNVELRKQGEKEIADAKKEGLDRIESKAESVAQKAADRQKALTTAAEKYADEQKRAADELERQKEAAKAVLDSIVETTAASSQAPSQDRAQTGRKKRQRSRAQDRANKGIGRDSNGNIVDPERTQRALDKAANDGLVSPEEQLTTQKEIDRVAAEKRQAEIAKLRKSKYKLDQQRANDLANEAGGDATKVRDFTKIQPTDQDGNPEAFFKPKDKKGGLDFDFPSERNGSMDKAAAPAKDPMQDLGAKLDKIATTLDQRLPKKIA